ncbi:MAG: TRAM domain-containing protein [Nanoarchaeota archaeon]|nr:TRAM domain-containing protein [Nanoarchaeota archaeon]
MDRRFGNRPQRFEGRRRFFAPVKEGEEINVKIDAIGEKGDGIAKVRGFVLIIPEAKVGDEVKVKITRVLRKVGFAEVIGDADGPIEAENREETTEEPEEETTEEPEEETTEEPEEETTEEPEEETTEEPEEKTEETE